MGEKKTTPITIDDVEYQYEDMTEQQQAVNHCNDLDRKIRSTQFNLDQLSVGKDAFVNMLVSSLENVKEVGKSKMATVKEAINRLEAHEKECLIRYKNIEKQPRS